VKVNDPGALRLPPVANDYADPQLGRCTPLNTLGTVMTRRLIRYVRHRLTR